MPGHGLASHLPHYLFWETRKKSRVTTYMIDVENPPCLVNETRRRIRVLRTRVYVIVGDYQHEQFHRLGIILTLLGSFMQEISSPNASGDPQADPQSP